MAVLRSPAFGGASTYTVVAVVAFAAGGLVTSSTADPDQGTASAAAPRPPPACSTQAAAKIEKDAEHPVSRAELDKAAVEGMLAVARRPLVGLLRRHRTTPRSASASRAATPASVCGCARASTARSPCRASSPARPPPTRASTPVTTSCSSARMPVTGNGIAAAAQALRGKGGTDVDDHGAHGRRAASACSP